MKPRTAPRGGKPHTAPEHGHAVLSQRQQSKLLGVGDEVTMNLGHRVPEDRVMEHPLNKVDDYANSHASERVVDGPKRGQSIYGRFKNPQSGVANEGNLNRWAGYAHAGSYQGGDGTGKEVSMRDPRGRRDEGSDGHLLRPEWDRYQFGADSGAGRLEKTHRK
jgi:hypothetical protein